MPERITSRSNARVKQLRAVLAKRQGDAIGIEGPHMLREAIASGLRLTSVFVREDLSASIDDLPPGSFEQVFLLPADVFVSVTATEHSQGIAAVLHRPNLEYVPRTGDLVLLADGVQDPGNLGTLLRSAEAFGASGVALGPGTVDPWNGKCLRAAAGAAFRLPTPRWSDDLRSAFRSLDGRLFASVVDGGEPAHRADLTGTVVLIVGNEGAGVSTALLAESDSRITLATTGPTESLNAAVAGSLLLYEASQQRHFR